MEGQRARLPRRGPQSDPYGIYDIGAGEGWGWGSVGARAETAAFVVNTLRQWWYTAGIDIYRPVEQLCLTGL